MAKLKRSAVLRYANADLVEEARMALELAGDFIAGREGMQPEQQPVVREDRHSLAARERGPEGERQRQRLQRYLQLKRYLQRMDPTV